MSPLILEILQLVVGIAHGELGGTKVAQGIDIADSLIQITQKAAQAYKEHTGQPLDPALIKFEEPIP